MIKKDLKVPTQLAVLLNLNNYLLVLLYLQEDGIKNIDSKDSDSLQVLQRFSTCGVIKTLKHIQGPYSFIFLDR